MLVHIFTYRYVFVRVNVRCNMKINCKLKKKYNHRACGNKLQIEMQRGSAVYPQLKLHTYIGEYKYYCVLKSIQMICKQSLNLSSSRNCCATFCRVDWQVVVTADNRTHEVKRNIRRNNHTYVYVPSMCLYLAQLRWAFCYEQWLILQALPEQSLVIANLLN